MPQEKKNKRSIFSVSVPLLLLTVGFFSIAVPFAALAQSLGEAVNVGLNYGTATGLGTRDLREVIFLIVNVFFGFLGIVAFLFLAYGGWVWMTSGGNAENINRAKRILTNTVIGLVLIFISYSLAAFIIRALVDTTGSGTSGQCPVLGADQACTKPGFPACVAHQVCIDDAVPGPPGVWGPCIDDIANAAYVAADCVPAVVACNATDVRPDDAVNPGFLYPRNSQVRVYFASNLQAFSGTADSFGIQQTDAVFASPTPLAGAGTACGVNTECASGECGAGGTCVGDYVQGSTQIIGSVAIFSPTNVDVDAVCPAGMDCFAPLSHYNVNIADPNAFVCVGGNTLQCGAGDVCDASFHTSDQVDLTPPTALVQPTQICEGWQANLEARVSDDVWVSQVEFFWDGAAIPGLYLPAANPDLATKNFIHGSFAREIVNVRAVATDTVGNTGEHDRDFEVRPGHCCNAVIDEDEEGIDCGGSCDACGSGPPIIDYVSPAIDVNNDNDPRDPSTYNEDQPHGTGGNFVTIFGRNFGNVRNPGGVEFLNGAGWVAAQLVNDRWPLVCTDPDWSNSRIIAEVPAGLTPGATHTIRVIEATRGLCSDGTTECTTDGTVACPAAVAPCTAVNYLDTTSDISPGERQIPDFDEDGVALPGICTAEPQVLGETSFGNRIRVRGVGYGAQDVNSKVRFGNILASYPPASWGGNTISDVEIPNLIPGVAWITVSKDAAPNVSNAYPFAVTSATDGPVIYDFTPKQGDTGSYVTIVGANFGNTRGAGTVRFNDGGTNTPGDFTFPDACLDGYWSNSQIVVKAPAGAGTGQLRVITDAGLEATTASLAPNDQFRYGFPVGPGLCKLSPPNGEPGVQLIEAYGDRLDTVSGPGHFVFHNSQIHTISGATPPIAQQFNNFGDPQLSVIRAGVDVQSGPVYGVDNAGVSGNSLNFLAGMCTSDDACGAGNECCVAGDFAGLCKPLGGCTGLPEVSHFGWTFMTGNLGPHVIEQCTATNECGRVCMGSTTGVSDGTPCTTIVECGGTGVCTTPISSPTPLYPRDTFVPVNAVVSARFDQLMDDLGGDNAINNPNNIVVQRCTTNDCTAFVGAPKTGALTFGTWDYRGVPDSAHYILFTPNAGELEANTWYQVELLSAIESSLGQALVGQGGPGTSYIWKFRTINSSDPGDAGCLGCDPGTTRLIGRGSTEDLRASAFSQDSACVLLNASALNWSWSVNDPDGRAFDIITDPLPNPSGQPNERRAIAENESVPGSPVQAQARIAGTTDLDKVGICSVEVEFEVPHISLYWPNCGSACVNAEVGARFDRLMNTTGGANSVNNAGNAKIYACGSDYECRTAVNMHNINAGIAIRDAVGTCGNSVVDADEQCDDGAAVSGDGCSSRCLLEGSSSSYGSICGNSAVETGENCDDGNTNNGDGCSSICLSTAAADQRDGTLPVGITATEVAFTIPPTYNRGFLIPGVYYRVVFDEDIQSNEGKVLGNLNYLDPKDGDKPAFSWVFGTGEDYNLCQISSVRVQPASVRKNVGERQIEYAQPYSTPDECSPAYGQRLNPIHYQWGWNLFDDPLPGNSENTDIANFVAGGLRDACGNGVRQIGEDCDDGNTDNNDGCSAVCLNEGSVIAGTTCGNGVIEPGEDCDDGNVAAGDGCSAVCLNEGVSDHTDKTICGNGKVEAPDEECDDGNIINGDGCSGAPGADNIVGGDRACILEGTIDGRALCGDGIVGPGESCETCGKGTASERTIVRGETCGDSDFGLNESVVSGDGCSDSCILENAEPDYASGSDLLWPAAICGNGVKEPGEDCDDGGWAPGDGCSATCLNEGSLYDTPAYNPPTVGPYQIVEALDDAIDPFYVMVQAATGGASGLGQFFVGAGGGGPGPGGGTTFEVISYQPTGGDNCRNQAIVVKFSEEPQAGSFNYGSNVWIREESDGDGTITAADNLVAITSSITGNSWVAWPDVGALDPGLYGAALTGDPPGWIVSQIGNPLDCSNGLCSWEFTIGNEFCYGTNVFIQPSINSDTRPATVSRYDAILYSDYKPPQVTAVNEVVDAGADNTIIQDASGVLQCDTKARICIYAKGADTFDIYAKAATGNCATTNNSISLTGLYDDATLQGPAGGEKLFIGCGLIFDADRSAGDFSNGDYWSVDITEGFYAQPPSDFSWSWSESPYDQGDPAISGSVVNPACAPDGTFPDNQCWNFMSVDPAVLNSDADPSNDWDPFEGMRLADISVEVVGQPSLRDSARLIVGDVCLDTYGSGTLYDVYPIERKDDTIFIAHFDDNLRAQTLNGARDPATADNVAFHDPGLSDGTNTLGKSIDLDDAAGNLQYDVSDLFNPARGSVSLWFYAPAGQDNRGSTFYRLSGPVTNDLFSLQFTNTNRFMAVYAPGGAGAGGGAGGSIFYFVPPGSAITTGRWHNMVITWEAEVGTFPVFEMYYDGEKLSVSATATGELTRLLDMNDMDPMYVGKSSVGNIAKGYIDEFEILSEKISEEIVQKRYIAYESCMEGAGATGELQIEEILPIDGNIGCRNPKKSIQFNKPVTRDTVFHTDAAGKYDNVILCQGNDCYRGAGDEYNNPARNTITEMSYDNLTNVLHITAPALLTANTRYTIYVRDGLTGVLSEDGFYLNATLGDGNYRQFETGDIICNCERANVKIFVDSTTPLYSGRVCAASSPDPTTVGNRCDSDLHCGAAAAGFTYCVPTQTLDDFFFCSGFNCPNVAGVSFDFWGGANQGFGNDHQYTASCVDLDAPATLIANSDLKFTWTEESPQIQALWKENGIPDDPSRILPLGGVTLSGGNDDLNGDGIGDNGSSMLVTNSRLEGVGTVTVKVEGEGTVVTGSDTFDVTVYNRVCANPWPPTGHYRDNVSSAGTLPDTNWDFWYCRDDGLSGSFLDDVPAISSTPIIRDSTQTVRPTIKEFIFPANYRLNHPPVSEREGMRTNGIEDMERLGTTECEWASDTLEAASASPSNAYADYTFTFPESKVYEFYMEIFNNDPNAAHGNPAEFSAYFVIDFRLDGTSIETRSIIAEENRQEVHVNLGYVEAGSHTVRVRTTNNDESGRPAQPWELNLAICRVGISERAEVKDVIGVKVLENPLHLSPATWYESGICQGTDPTNLENVCFDASDCLNTCEFNVPNRGNYSEMEFDLDEQGNYYPAIRSGRSVYVGAANRVGNNLFSNIYLLSYNEGAHSQTQEIVDMLLNNWNIIAEAEQGSLRQLKRDVQRYGDIQDIRIELNRYNRRFGYYPLWDATRGQFVGGTYLPGISMSTWPSWTANMSPALTIQMPLDPINTFNRCPWTCCDRGTCAGGELCNADSITCWDETALEFECPEFLNDTYVYGYRNRATAGAPLTVYNFERANLIDAVRWPENLTAQLGNICGNAVEGDLDGDGIPDVSDNCAPDRCPGDVWACNNPGQADSDGDGIGDACDTCPNSSANDADRDGICGDIDNCPDVFNPDQEDADGNGDGDACDATCESDSDGDGVCDNRDNCPFVANPGQGNFDGFGGVNVCNNSSPDAASRGNLCNDDSDCGGAAGGFAFCVSPDRRDGQVWPNGEQFGDACDPCTDMDGDGYATTFCGGNFLSPTCNTDSDCAAGVRCLPLPASTQCAPDNCSVSPAGFGGGLPNPTFNPGQEDFDNDLIGYQCEECIDSDNDSFPDPIFLTSFESGADGWVLYKPSGDASSVSFSEERSHLDDTTNEPVLPTDLAQHGIRALQVFSSTAARKDLYYKTILPGPSAEDIAGLQDQKVWYRFSAWAKGTTDVRAQVYRECHNDPSRNLTPTVYRADCYGSGDWSYIGALGPGDAQVAPGDDDWHLITFSFYIDRSRSQEQVLILFGMNADVGDRYYFDNISLMPIRADGSPNTCGVSPDNCSNFNNPGRCEDDWSECTRDIDCGGGARCLQPDWDKDHIGDDCDLCTDKDADGFGDRNTDASIPRDGTVDTDFAIVGCPGSFNQRDNCPISYNPGQGDLDEDAETCNYATSMPYVTLGTDWLACADPANFPPGACDFCGGDACDLDADSDRCYNWEQLSTYPYNSSFALTTWTDVAAQSAANNDLQNREEDYLRTGRNSEETWLNYSGDLDADGLPDDCDAQACGNARVEFGIPGDINLCWNDDDGDGIPNVADPDANIFDFSIGFRQCEECDSNQFGILSSCDMNINPFTGVAGWRDIYPMAGEAFVVNLNGIYFGFEDMDGDGTNTVVNPSIAAGLELDQGLYDSLHPPLGASVVMKSTSELVYPEISPDGDRLYNSGAGSINVWVKPNRAVSTLNFGGIIAPGAVPVSTWSANSWHMLTGIWGGGVYSIYVDGQRVKQDVLIPPSGDIDVKFWLWALGLQVDDPTNPGFAVSIDEFAIFSQQLNMAEIGALFGAVLNQCLGELAAEGNVNQYMIQNYCASCDNLQCSIDVLRTCREVDLGDVELPQVNDTEYAWIANSDTNTATQMAAIPVPHPVTGLPMPVGQIVHEYRVCRTDSVVGGCAPGKTCPVDDGGTPGNPADDLAFCVIDQINAAGPCAAGSSDSCNTTCAQTTCTAYATNPSRTAVAVELEQAWVAYRGGGVAQFDQKSGLMKFCRLPQWQRGVAIDSEGNAWVGDLDRTNQLNKISGNNASCERLVNLNTNVYGLAMDSEDNLWISQRGSGTVGVMTDVVNMTVPLTLGSDYFIYGGFGQVYGIGVDLRDRGWAAQYKDGFSWRIDRSRTPVEVLRTTQCNQGSGRGVGVTIDGRVLVAKSASGWLTWYNADDPNGAGNCGNYGPFLPGITGVSGDSQGKIWATGPWANTVWVRNSDGTEFATIAQGSFSGGGHYMYSDFLGLNRALVFRTGAGEFPPGVSGVESVGSTVYGWNGRWGKILYDIRNLVAGINDAKVYAYITDDPSDFNTLTSRDWIPVDARSADGQIGDFNSRIPSDGTTSRAEWDAAGEGADGWKLHTTEEVVGKYLKIRIFLSSKEKNVDAPIIDNMRITCRGEEGRNICL